VGSTRTTCSRRILQSNNTTHQGHDLHTTSRRRTRHALTHPKRMNTRESPETLPRMQYKHPSILHWEKVPLISECGLP